MRASLLFCLTVTWGAMPAVAQPGDASRGQLLYSTHCIQCHTTQMHWREKGRARDWETLVAQVRRWQGEAMLQWSEQDIQSVARHLNDTIYRHPRPQTVGQADIK